jgi:bifunctional DNase/RNase
MDKVKLEIAGLSYSQTQSGAYALVLIESGGKRQLPIIIGGFEAQAIAIELEKMTPTRPLTHDLFKSFASSFDIKVNEIVIYNLNEGIFYSKLVCFTANDTIEIDSRTSDAIALAVRFGCPIYVYSNILEQAGLTNENSEKNIQVTPINEPTKINDLSILSLHELNTLLKEVLDQEDYIRAIDIRDEINKRNAQKKS